MIRSYALIDAENNVAGWFRTLHAAKLSADEGESVLALRGPYFGEGFHFYKLTLTNGKWSKKKLR